MCTVAIQIYGGVKFKKIKCCRGWLEWRLEKWWFMKHTFEGTVHGPEYISAQDAVKCLLGVYRRIINQTKGYNMISVQGKIL